ncbi:hypothetical protein K9U39_00265 [Rhodoblastus acidophilus]|uniref:Uncharacterized protein n=1 Tax=Candidatus Rhodoblastus alkanivorans TaxID=2954117 RepID=A0ABS9Z363_9HYPH|nr:hypothetical protein [Candidatus Rhodoblastus alkanivorans]MCI4677358.1 hypothetical protein [Candidatus Rhodoblastus alkanivorans]MCI4682093.1 hypothetical protein [Candidatus Rhodoblastus alkanivorans]MDI4639395.1 hypothetical protein [Rhodoblastus acidophilus]
MTPLVPVDGGTPIVEYATHVALEDLQNPPRQKFRGRLKEMLNAQASPGDMQGE